MRAVLILIISVGLLLPSFGQLIINEYVSSNYSIISDEDDDYSDWLELYNNTGTTIDLTNYSVTDDISLPEKWIFPSISIDPYNYLLIFASAKDRKDASVFLHTNFKLDSDGEGLYLFNASNKLVDSIIPVSLPTNISYGRGPNGSKSWYYFVNPTPSDANITSGESGLEIDTVFFSVTGGIHIGGLSLELSSENPTNEIYYTTDGSDPDKNDNLYSEPISILTPTVIRARAYSAHTIPNPIFTNTYVTEINHEFPIVCLSTNPINLWDDNEGIFVLGPTYEQDDPHYGANYWEEWEKMVHLEYYDNAGVKQLDQLAGMKVFGGYSRMNDQKSVALFARDVYGKGSFKYKLFDNKPIDKFESFVLRNGGNDYWDLRFQDELLTSLTDEMNVDRQAYKPSIVYLNGEYWGIMNIREKVNENYIAENHHVYADEVNLLEYDGMVIFGNNEKYQSIIYYLGTNPTLTNSDKYNWVADQLDIDNYIQYQLTQIFVDNEDWPGNNIKFWNTSSPGSKWRWILFDTDFGFGYFNSDVSFNTLSFALATNGRDWPNPPWSTLLFRRLVSNPEFRNNFINQYADRINTNFKTSVVAAKLDYFKNLYESEIQYHKEKFGGGDYNWWLELINYRKTYGTYRPYHARNHIQEVFNLTGQLEININVSSSVQGNVKINSIIPKSYPFSGIYFQNIPIKMTAVPNPGYKFVRWEGFINSSDLTIEYNMASAGSFKAVFSIAVPEDISVVINEINYNSSDNYASKDWIEIFNNGTATADLSNWLISDRGVDTGFVFPVGLSLAPGEYYVIYSDLESFKTIYPNINNICGKLSFGLSSSGDQIFLYDSDRNLVDYVEYDNYAPWDNRANGKGFTLELLDPTYDNILAVNWEAGVPGGTPGNVNRWDYVSIPSTTLTLNDQNITCFPNPFSDYTTISFNIATESFVRLEVYDLNGSLVEELVNERLVPDTYYYDWSGNTMEGRNLPAGIYNIRLSNNLGIINFKIVKL